MNITIVEKSNNLDKNQEQILKDKLLIIQEHFKSLLHEENIYNHVKLNFQTINGINCLDYEIDGALDVELIGIIEDTCLEFHN